VQQYFVVVFVAVVVVVACRVLHSTPLGALDSEETLTINTNGD